MKFIQNKRGNLFVWVKMCFSFLSFMVVFLILSKVINAFHTNAIAILPSWTAYFDEIVEYWQFYPHVAFVGHFIYGLVMSQKREPDTYAF